MAIQKRYYIVSWFTEDIGKDWVICESLDEAVELHNDLEKQNALMLCISHIVKNSIVSIDTWKLDEETIKEK